MLQILHLHGQISSIEFDAFADLTHLEVLDVSRCHLRRISMDAFTNCRNLRIVNLARNDLSMLPPGLFDDLPALEEVYLEQNKLQTLPGFFAGSRSHTLKLVRLVDNPWQCSCDMISWKAKITNQERIPPENHCIHDFSTGNKIFCRPEDSTQYNRQFTPRCANFKGRSVFYVLRKHLRCPPQKSEVVRTRSRENPRRLAHWQKWNAVSKKPLYNVISHKEKPLQKIALEQRETRTKAVRMSGSNHLLWQIRANSINEKSTEHRKGQSAQNLIENNDNADLPNVI